ncbi:WG repeat-containing protein [Marinoscillum furvescens]|uniref:WG repeat protein n=1 Tax=Marinoscillum furvescens DSM 4134 TaxID=1122208 RepID=A0A3D9L5K6_MARFU|nr:WG repeat-containing protein [Marinoscillum furvescens]RED99821.1 hypothetical protein C7460_107103 [Marinoscillum furvescens DSM 4134]
MMKITPLLLALCLWSGPSMAQPPEKIDLHKLKENSTLWANGAFFRAYQDGKYYLTDTDGQVVVDGSNYQFMADFQDGLAQVVTRNGRHGFITISGEIAIDTLWDKSAPFVNGFGLVGKYNGKQTLEDRGEGGIKSYPMIDWFLISPTNQIVSVPFRQTTPLGSKLAAIDASNQSLLIDLSKVRTGYYHPLMKAIKKVNNRPVRYEINAEKKAISYLDLDTNKELYTLSFQDQEG